VTIESRKTRPMKTGAGGGWQSVFSKFKGTTVVAQDE
jgi:hypothetical protein